ncbi:hypothetical protein [Gorillibacterium sp. CAU 1737]|uniref:hypothetical protein n=1 Tax=Gorillibacterium sp. CAU 1737 TaxID=3140362 RepID=UPI003261AD87
MKKSKYGSAAISILLIAFGLYQVMPWILTEVVSLFNPSLPKPAITYEEFPFRLEYEIHGQKKVIEDTLICEYDGVSINEGNGKSRKWKQRFESGREEIILLKMAGTNEISYSPGPARYYMGDSSYSFKDFFPDASITELVGGFLETRRIRSDELFKMYGIRLLKWEISPPIVNSFTQKHRLSQKLSR